LMRGFYAKMRHACWRAAARLAVIPDDR